jgi:hypothetical protein
MSAILGLLSDRKLGSLDFQGLYAGNNSNNQPSSRTDSAGNALVRFASDGLIPAYFLQIDRLGFENRAGLSINQ